VLRALAHPLSLLVLIASFVFAVTLHGWVQALVARAFGDRRPAAEHQTRPDPRRHIDPFGAVAALLSGLGWTKPVELLAGRRRSAQLAVALSGPVVNIAIGCAALVVWRVAYLTHPGLDTAPSDVQPGLSLLLQTGTSMEGAIAERALVLFGVVQLYVGALSLVPLPPLDGGRLLFALGPRSPGWQKAEYQLVERNIGVVVLLVLLLIPIGRGGPLLPHLLDIALSPLISVVLGA